jgi:hypothetical protein
MTWFGYLNIKVSRNAIVAAAMSFSPSLAFGNELLYRRRVPRLKDTKSAKFEPY